MAPRSSHGLSHGLFVCVGWTLAAIIALAASIAPATAELVQIRAAKHADFGRLMFFWPTPVTYETAGNGDRLIIRFQRPINADYDAASEKLGQYLGVLEPDPDGRSVVIPLRDGVTARSFALDNAVVVDLLRGPQGGTGVELETAAAESEPVPPPKLPVVRVRTGEHPGFSRIVFDWPNRVDYQVRRSGATASITFDQPARVDLRRLDRRPLRYVKSGSSQSSGGTATVVLDVPEGSKARHFRIGPRVVIDVLGSDAGAAKTPVPPDAETVEAGAESQTPTPQTAAEPAKPAEPTAPPAAAAPPVKQPEPEKTPENAAENRPEKAVESPSTEPAAPIVSGDKAPATEAPQTAELRFDWDQPVGAAVFRRAGSLWVVFDSRTGHDVNAPAGSETVIRDLQPIPVERATALRMTTPETVNPRVERDGLSWILRFGEQLLAARDTIEARTETDENGGVRLFLPVPEPGVPIALTDPEVGDNLIVVPVIPLGHGVTRTYTYPQLRLLVTAQGVVIQPFIDNLRVRSLPDGIEITTDGDLSVSPVSKEIQAGARVGSPKGLTRLLALEKWIDADTVPFDMRRRALQRAVVDAAPSETEQARLDLARFFLANSYAAEAFGALALTAQHRPEIEDQPEFRAMRGVSQLLLGRLPEAREDLFHRSLNGNDEAALWRAAVEAAEGHYSRAAVNFKDSISITQTYPKRLRTPLNLLLAEAAIAADQSGPAADLMEVLRAEVSTPAEKSWLSYLEGRYLEAIGDYPGALDTWAAVAEGPDRRNGAKAAMAATELSLKTGDITREQAIDALESLRFAWRGDALEVRLLRRLAGLYQEKEDYLSGLRTLRRVAANFSGIRQAPEITKEMSTTFERLFLEGHADALPAVSAIALYREFQELTPTGDKGNEMIRMLADRMVEVDLLDDAAALLEKQVRYRLSGVEKAKVGARLALVHRLNRDPQAAIDALRVSATSDLPEDLKRQRDRLTAEALAELGKGKQALSVLGDDDSLEADLIRSRIFWASEDWTNAGQVLSHAVRKAGVETGKPLSEDQSRLVLNLAVALTLAGDEDSVARLRKDYVAGMAASPLRDAFRLITGSQSNSDVAARDWSTQIKQAENFQAYLAVYRAQLERDALSAVD